MKLYKTRKGTILHSDSVYFSVNKAWDHLINHKNLFRYLINVKKKENILSEERAREYIQHHLLPPIGHQEVWAAGVTYLKSREARMEEAKIAGGVDFYQRVYDAVRPELFFKSAAHRVAGHQQAIYIRRDSSWNVPEPELTLLINRYGNISGYTIGNDVSSRSIEGENPLYLPQAKIYERSASLGPCLYIPEKPLPVNTTLSMTIRRSHDILFSQSASINQMKRSLKELTAFLYRGLAFPQGCFLMTGTSLVPQNDFTLLTGDEVEIEIDPIGKLINPVEVYG